MSRPSFEEVRAALTEKKGGDNQTRTPNNYYPFWNMKVGERCVIRFVPDLDESNPRSFMYEKLTHTLQIGDKKQTVVCRKQIDPSERCPICDLSQKYYKVEDKVNGKKYWRNKQALAQCIVVEDPLPPDPTTGEKHTGKLRFISLGYQLTKVISEAYVDELQDHPDLVEGGVDFVIKKTDNGNGNAQYNVGCRFMSRPRDLTPAELEEYEANAVDLKTLVQEPWSEEKVQALLEAALSGESFEDDFETPESAETKPAPTTTQRRSSVVDEDEDEDEVAPVATRRPVPKQEDSDAPAEAEDLMAAIRRRRGKA